MEALNLIDLEDAVGDTPHFRQRLATATEHSEQLASKLKKFTRTCKQLQSSAQAYASDYKMMAEEMKEFYELSRPGDITSLEKGISIIGDRLYPLEGFHKQMSKQVRHLLVSPVEALMQREMSRVKTASRRFESLKQKYSQALSKHSNTPKSSPKFFAAEEGLASAKAEFLNASLEMSLALNDLEASKRTELLECVTAFISTQVAYHHQSYDQLKTLDPYVSKLNATLATIRTEYQESHVAQLDRKTELTHQTVGMGVQTDSAVETNAPTSGSHEGYLFHMEKSGRSKTWKRRYFVCESGYLSYFRDEKSLGTPAGQLNLMLCTVKEETTSTKRNYSFEVVNPQETFVLQGQNPTDKQRWIDELYHGIKVALASDSVPTPRVGSSSSTKSNPSNFVSASTSTATHSDPDELVRALVKKHPSNGFCADCGRSDPTWASINTCALVCINCSGVHRSMGTHISKVRSLTLDKWSVALKAVMLKISNDNVNSVLLHSYDRNAPGAVNENSSLAELSEHINNKYGAKLWLKKTVEGTDLSAELFRYLRQKNLSKVYELVLRGALETSASTTALHVASRLGDPVFMEFLIQHGASIYALDQNGQTCLHAAAQSGSHLAIAVLCLHGVNLEIMDSEGKTALDLALTQQNAKIATLLRIAKLDESSVDSSPLFADAMATFEEEEVENRTRSETDPALRKLGRQQSSAWVPHIPPNRTPSSPSPSPSRPTSLSSTSPRGALTTSLRGHSNSSPRSTTKSPSPRGTAASAPRTAVSSSPSTTTPWTATLSQSRVTHAQTAQSADSQATIPPLARKRPFTNSPVAQKPIPPPKPSPSVSHSLLPSLSPTSSPSTSRITSTTPTSPRRATYTPSSSNYSRSPSNSVSASQSHSESETTGLGGARIDMNRGRSGSSGGLNLVSSGVSLSQARRESGGSSIPRSQSAGVVVGTPLGRESSQERPICSLCSTPLSSSLSPSYSSRMCESCRSPFDNPREPSPVSPRSTSSPFRSRTPPSPSPSPQQRLSQLPLTSSSAGDDLSPLRERLISSPRMALEGFSEAEWERRRERKKRQSVRGARQRLREKTRSRESLEEAGPSPLANGERYM